MDTNNTKSVAPCIDVGFSTPNQVGIMVFARKSGESTWLPVKQIDTGNDCYKTMNFFVYKIQNKGYNVISVHYNVAA